MRPALALVVVAVAFAAAVWLQQFTHPEMGHRCVGCTDMVVWGHVHPKWADPLAVHVAIGGLAGATAILTAGRHKVAA